jgi:hypothetical protein
LDLNRPASTLPGTFEIHPSYGLVATAGSGIERLSSASGRTNTAFGPVFVSWSDALDAPARTRNSNTDTVDNTDANTNTNTNTAYVNLQVTIPVDMLATVWIPGGKDAVNESGTAAGSGKVPGVEFLRSVTAYNAKIMSVWRVASGNYSFDSQYVVPTPTPAPPPSPEPVR